MNMMFSFTIWVEQLTLYIADDNDDKSDMSTHFCFCDRLNIHNRLHQMN